MTKVLPYVWYPLLFTLAIVGFSAMLAHDVALLVALYTTIVVAGVAIVTLEILNPERADWRPGTSDVCTDAAFMVAVQIVTPRLLTMLAVLLIARMFHEPSTGPWPHQWPLAAQTLLMVLAVDFMRYWLHRASHRFAPLWRLHEVHHCPDILYTLNTARFHPLEKLLQFCFDTVPFLLLGVAPQVIAAYFLLYAVNGFFQHCNAHLRFGFLNYLVASAELHRWHHARDPKTAMCNFSNTTIIWDLLFDTWYLPRDATLDIGITDRNYPRGFWAQMLAPFRRRANLPDGLRGTLKNRLVNLALGIDLRLRNSLHRARLYRALRDPMRAQRAVLARILRENRATRFGRQYDFASITDERTYRDRVPVHDYEMLRPYVEAEIDTGEQALTRQAPVHYLRTSGTTGRAKDIPLTRSHLEQLRRLQRQSVAAQYRRYPGAFAGSILAIASPAVEGRLANGRPFGSASAIVAGGSPALVRDKFVLPAQVADVTDSRLKYLLIARLAIARRDLSYLGTANPSTLLALMAVYRRNEAALIRDLRSGGFFAHERLPADVLSALAPHLAADPERADELDRLRGNGSGNGNGGALGIAQIWPGLQLVVTWTCASAGVALAVLRKELAAHTRIHELGYLSSEFMGTITIGKRPGSGLLSYDTHYFEFVERERWESGAPQFLALDQLRKGHDYYVLVTTPSGLYRYFINDLIRVTGIVHRMPLVRFLQKGKGVTNITGEKLYESQVLEAVTRVMADMGRVARFVMALADESARRYRLYVEPRFAPAAADTRTAARQLAVQVDTHLQALNIEYRAKRESGRLEPLLAFWLRAGTEAAFREACVAQGQREGQLKTVALAYRAESTFDLDARVDATVDTTVDPA